MTVDTEYPVVSVVIPCRNEEHHIGMCLKSIAANDYPKDRMEVLVVDGMSEDGTRAIVASYGQKYSFLRVLDNPRKITPAAMNVGLKAARGAVIIIAGAHAEYPSDFVANAIESLRRTGADVVGGPVITKPGANTAVGRAIASVRSHPFGVGNSKFRTSNTEGYVDTVPFGAYRREVFNAVGLFDERLGRNQDNEMNDRIVRSGRKIFLTPRLTATYCIHPTLRKFLKHAFSVGMWNVRTLRITPFALRWRHFVPFGFVTALLTLGTLAILNAWARLAFFALVGSYASLAAACSLRARRREGAKNAAFQPVVFFLYHVAYGVGSLVGLLTIAVTGWQRQPNSILGARM